MKYPFKYTLTLLATLVSLYSQQMPQDYYKYLGGSDLLWDDNPGNGVGSVCVMPNGEIYGAFGNTIRVFDPDGAEVRQISGFDSIYGIAYGGPDSIFVHNYSYSDNTAPRIIKLNAAGGVVDSFGNTLGGAQNFTSNVYSSESIAIDSKGRVLAVDTFGYRILVFEQDGTFVTSFGGAQGSLDHEYSQYPDAIVVMPDGRIIVAERFGSRYHVYSSDYEHVELLNIAECEGLAATADGLLIVGYDSYNLRREHFELRVYDGEDLLHYYKSPAFPYLGVNYYRYARSISPMPSGDLVISTGLNLLIARRIYNDVDSAKNVSAIPQAYVKTVSQRAGSTLVDIDYIVSDSDSSTVETAIVVYTGTPSLSNLLLPESLAEGTESNLGTGVATNTLHRITWNAAADWDVDTGTIQVEVLANDGRALLPIHWVTTPHDDVTSSKNPITNNDLYSLWVWLIAKGDPAISLVNGQVIGVGGTYDGQMLCSGTTTSTAGRNFLYERLGVATYSGEYVKPAGIGF